MRKQIIAPVENNDAIPTAPWLDLDELAIVQVTSEQEAFPIDSVFVSEGPGWHAASQGIQTIRLIFDKPQRITRIWLLFVEPGYARTQEFVLRWSPDNGRSFREIVRQQWNFSPPNSLREIENYTLELPAVTMLELEILPDTRGGETKASLAKLFLA